MKLSLAFLALVAMALGLRTGWRYSSFTEGDAIAMAAADYVAAEASRGNAVQPTDCSHQPGGGDPWVRVTCDPPHLGPGKVYLYDVDRSGHMDRMNPY